jgi:hypothetical protein
MNGTVVSIRDNVITINPDGMDKNVEYVFNYPYETAKGKVMNQGALSMMKGISTFDKVEYAYGKDKDVDFLKFIKKVDASTPKPDGYASGDANIRQQLILLQHWENVMGEAISRNPEMFNIVDETGLEDAGTRFLLAVKHYSRIGYAADCRAFGITPIVKLE